MSKVLHPFLLAGTARQSWADGVRLLPRTQNSSRPEAGPLIDDQHDIHAFFGKRMNPIPYISLYGVELWGKRLQGPQDFWGQVSSSRYTPDR